MRDRFSRENSQRPCAPIAWRRRSLDRLTKAIDDFSLNTLDAIRASGFDEAVALRAVTEGRKAISAVLVSTVEPQMIEDATEAGNAS